MTGSFPVLAGPLPYNLTPLPPLANVLQGSCPSMGKAGFFYSITRQSNLTGQ